MEDMIDSVTVMNEYEEGGGDYSELERPRVNIKDCVEEDTSVEELDENTAVEDFIKSQGLDVTSIRK